jgi:sortase A
MRLQGVSVRSSLAPADVSFEELPVLKRPFASGVVSRSRPVLLCLECLTLVAGLSLLIVVAQRHLSTYVYSQSALRAFDERTSRSLHIPERVDFALWSPDRIRLYEESLKHDTFQTMAVLQIQKIGLRVPVFEGTDEDVLNRGVGRIAGTALPGQPGNLGIAGHRDGFFRGLKDIARGDLLELQLPDGAVTYRVDEIEIVSPDDVRVLERRATDAITLVTCYPFYFVGSAPQRFIVHGARVDAESRISAARVAQTR